MTNPANATSIARTGSIGVAVGSTVAVVLDCSADGGAATNASGVAARVASSVGAAPATAIGTFTVTDFVVDICGFAEAASVIGAMAVGNMPGAALGSAGSGAG